MTFYIILTESGKSPALSNPICIVLIISFLLTNACGTAAELSMYISETP